MRGVGVRGSLLACVSAAAILVFAPRPAAAEDTAALSPDPDQTAPSHDDYYTRRAKRMLEAERRAAVKPHPLAAYYPGMDIVVCEAGCPIGRGAQVVAARKHVEPTETREGFLVPTSAHAATTQDTTDSSSDAACIAGCYDATDSRPLPRLVTPPRVERMALPPRDKLSPIR
jgi:hypothetical protein